MACASVSTWSPVLGEVSPACPQSHMWLHNPLEMMYTSPQCCKDPVPKEGCT